MSCSPTSSLTRPTKGSNAARWPDPVRRPPRPWLWRRSDARSMIPIARQTLRLNGRRERKCLSSPATTRPCHRAAGQGSSPAARSMLATLIAVAFSRPTRGWSGSPTTGRRCRPPLRRPVNTAPLLPVPGVDGVPDEDWTPSTTQVRDRLGSHVAGVDRHMPVEADGTVNVGGSVDCPAGTPAHIHFRLVQPSTGAAAEGDWFGTCTGEGPSRAHWERAQPSA